MTDICVEEPSLAYGTSPIEEERHRIQLIIDKTKTPEERNRLGQFPTPFLLARQMVAHAVPFLSLDETIRFVEPSVGTGVFLSAIDSNTVLMRRIGSVVGVEIDPLYARHAQKIWGARGFSIILDDFAKFVMNGERRLMADFICTNPPYVRHHHIPGPLKDLMRSEILSGLSLKVSGLA
ncbi:MAG: class I SAM-dependent methyltransferase, partial [Opitutaceae bacterium]|nr:class I SAM-dependent methyltransferase [Opitutaceae bacterium]